MTDRLLIDAHTIVRFDQRRVLWNGSCDYPTYQLLCETCGSLSFAVASAADAMDMTCESCRTHREGLSRASSFKARAFQQAAQRRPAKGGRARSALHAGPRVH